MRPIIVNFPKTFRTKSPEDLICVGFTVNNRIFIGVDPDEPAVVDWIYTNYKRVEDWVEERGYITIFRFQISEIAAQSLNEAEGDRFI